LLNTTNAPCFRPNYLDKKKLVAALENGTFETHPDGSNTAFAFHENLGEGQEVYFLAKFPAGEDSARIAAETIFGSIVDALKFDARGEVGDRFEDVLKAANNQAQFGFI